MNKFFNDLIIVLLFGLFAAFLYFYIPSPVKTLHQRVSQSSPLNLNQDRLDLFKQYGNFVMDKLPEKTPKLYFYWLSAQRKLADLRVKTVVNEIKSTKVQEGKLKIWSLLNMGVVIKINQHTIAIDTANLPFSQAHNELVEIVDIFLVTHLDGDHFDASLLQKALAQNKKVVFLDGFVFDSDKPENIIFLSSGTDKTLDNLKITAYQTDHRGDGNFREANAWFVIETEGFKILHTGDGRDFKNKDEEKKVYGMKDIDVLLGNIMIHPYNVRDLSPRLYVPLHLFKFMSGKELYQESTIEAVLNIHQQYEKDLKSIEKIYLLPGEGFTYPLN